MKISCLQENLSRGLGTVGRAVASRATLPVTQNVLLTADQGMLRLSGTNLEIAMTTWIGAMVEEEGAVTVPARLLTEFVNSLGSDRIDMDIEEGSYQLQIKSGRSQANINGTDASRISPHPHGGRCRGRPRRGRRPACRHRPRRFRRRHRGIPPGPDRRGNQAQRGQIHDGRRRRFPSCRPSRPPDPIPPPRK